MLLLRVILYTQGVATDFSSHKVEDFKTISQDIKDTHQRFHASRNYLRTIPLIGQMVQAPTEPLVFNEALHAGLSLDEKIKLARDLLKESSRLSEALAEKYSDAMHVMLRSIGLAPDITELPPVMMKGKRRTLALIFSAVGRILSFSCMALTHIKYLPNISNISNVSKQDMQRIPKRIYNIFANKPYREWRLGKHPDGRTYLYDALLWFSGPRHLEEKAQFEKLCSGKYESTNFVYDTIDYWTSVELE